MQCWLVSADRAALIAWFVTDPGRPAVMITELLRAHRTMPLMYEEYDIPGARVSAVCLEASPLAPLARKLFSARKIFTLYDQKVSAIKIVSALKRRSAPPGTGRTGQVGRQGPP